MKKGLVFILVVLILLCFSNYAFASILDGRPAAFEAEENTGYFIWQDKNGLHVRATTAGPEHSFSGIIRTDGSFQDVFSKARGANDYCRISDDRGKITFWFTASGDEAGLDLHVTDGTYVNFKLSMDGEDVDSAKIFIGGEGWHPGGNKFTLQKNSVAEEKGPTCNESRTIIIIVGGFWWGHFPHDWPHDGPHGGPPDGPRR
ncbi:MAG: hypothetical protein P4N59_19730 [Negativicutes bacterium]|nr:hypothetical protein [Negativicutes bacterium]